MSSECRCDAPVRTGHREGGGRPDRRERSHAPVDYLKHSVRGELPYDVPLWTASRHSLVCRTLENIVSSDETVAPTLVHVGVVPLLHLVLEPPNADAGARATPAELRAALRCLWALSHDAEALQEIAREPALIKGRPADSIAYIPFK